MVGFSWGLPLETVAQPFDLGSWLWRPMASSSMALASMNVVVVILAKTVTHTA